MTRHSPGPHRASLGQCHGLRTSTRSEFGMHWRFQWRRPRISTFFETPSVVPLKIEPNLWEKYCVALRSKGLITSWQNLNLDRNRAAGRANPTQPRALHLARCQSPLKSPQLVGQSGLLETFWSVAPLAWKYAQSCKRTPRGASSLGPTGLQERGGLYQRRV
jgi:hypothetical protein